MSHKRCLIICPLKWEAKPLIKALGLTQIQQTPYRIYENGDFVLTICGVGEQNASNALSYTVGMYSVNQSPVGCCVLFGVGGSGDIEVGSLCIAYKISSEGKRDIYPTITLKNSLTPCTVITGSSLVLSEDAPVKHGTYPLTLCGDKRVYDMEGYAFAQTAIGLLSPHSVNVVRLVSDKLTPNAITPEDVLSLCESKAAELTQYLNDFLALTREIALRREKYNIPLPRYIEDCIAQNRFTATQRAQIEEGVKKYRILFNGEAPGEDMFLPRTKSSRERNVLVLHLCSEMGEACKGQQANINRDADNEGLSKALIPHLFNIYVEEGVIGDEGVNKIISRLNRGVITTVSHYKDVFNISQRGSYATSLSKPLILAKTPGQMLYKGSRMCNSFDAEEFYYASDMFGCPYSCEYCWLKGQFTSCAVVYFADTKAIDDELSHLNDGTLVCCSYESEALGLNGVLDGFSRWYSLARKYPNIRFEIRTKSTFDISGYSPLKNMTLAWSVAPQCVCSEYEHYAPSLTSRLKASKRAGECGWCVRLCAEPLIYTDNFKADCNSLVDEMVSTGALEYASDVEIGCLRMSLPHASAVEKRYPPSKIMASPYLERVRDTQGESLTYPQGGEMGEYLKGLIEKRAPNKRIFVYEERFDGV